MYTLMMQSSKASALRPTCAASCRMIALRLHPLEAGHSISRPPFQKDFMKIVILSCESMFLRLEDFGAKEERF